MPRLPLMMRWTAPTTGIAMCQIAPTIKTPQMTGVGYKRKFQPCCRHVRLSPNRRHSLADVRHRADFVRKSPGSRHSRPNVRFLGGFASFTPDSGRHRCAPGTGVYDPTRTFRVRLANRDEPKTGDSRNLFVRAWSFCAYLKYGNLHRILRLTATTRFSRSHPAGGRPCRSDLLPSRR